MYVQGRLKAYMSTSCYVDRKLYFKLMKFLNDKGHTCKFKNITKVCLLFSKHVTLIFSLSIIMFNTNFKNI